MAEVSLETSPKNILIQDMINSITGEILSGYKISQGKWQFRRQNYLVNSKHFAYL